MQKSRRHEQCSQCLSRTAHAKYCRVRNPFYMRSLLSLKNPTAVAKRACRPNPQLEPTHFIASCHNSSVFSDVAVAAVYFICASISLSQNVLRGIEKKGTGGERRTAGSMNKRMMNYNMLWSSLPSIHSSYFLQHRRCYTCRGIQSHEQRMFRQTGDDKKQQAALQ